MKNRAIFLIGPVILAVLVCGCIRGRGHDNAYIYLPPDVETTTYRALVAPSKETPSQWHYVDMFSILAPGGKLFDPGHTGEMKEAYLMTAAKLEAILAEHPLHALQAPASIFKDYDRYAASFCIRPAGEFALQMYLAAEPAKHLLDGDLYLSSVRLNILASEPDKCYLEIAYSAKNMLPTVLAERYVYWLNDGEVIAAIWDFADSCFAETAVYPQPVTDTTTYEMLIAPSKEKRPLWRFGGRFSVWIPGEGLFDWGNPKWTKHDYLPIAAELEGILTGCTLYPLQAPAEVDDYKHYAKILCYRELDAYTLKAEVTMTPTINLGDRARYLSGIRIFILAQEPQRCYLDISYTAKNMPSVDPDERYVYWLEDAQTVAALRDWANSRFDKASS